MNYKQVHREALRLKMVRLLKNHYYGTINTKSFTSHIWIHGKQKQPREAAKKYFFLVVGTLRGMGVV